MKPVGGVNIGDTSRFFLSSLNLVSVSFFAKSTAVALTEIYLVNIVGQSVFNSDLIVLGA